MKVRYTLISDGPTDAALIPIIDWTLRQAGVELSEGKRAEFWRLPQPPRDLSDRLLKATKLFPCDLLVIHRDAEKQAPSIRVDEIKQAYESAQISLPAVCAIPVRMLEAWLCFDEGAVRQAVGNPNGAIALPLPMLDRVESQVDPKGELKNALLVASELKGRRRKKFNVERAFWRITDYVSDFSALRRLASFQTFERPISSLSNNDSKAGLY